MKKIYLVTLAIITLILMSGIEVHAAENDNYGHVAYVIYTGESGTYDFMDYDKSNGYSFRVENGTTAKLTFSNFEPSWRLISIGEGTEARLYVFNLDKYDLEYFTPNSGYFMYPSLFSSYINGKTFNVAVGHAFTYPCNASIVSGSLVFNGIDLSDFPLGYGFRGSPRISCYYRGIPNFPNWDDNQLEIYASIIQNYDYNYTPPTPTYAYPILEKLDNGYTSYKFKFDENTHKEDVLVRNISIKARNLNNTNYHESSNENYSLNQSLGYTATPPIWFKIFGGNNKPEIDFYTLLAFGTEYAPYSVTEISFEIAYKYQSGISNWVKVVYDGTTGGTSSQLLGTDTPNINLPGNTPPGYITNPSTQITGAELSNIFTDWINNLGLSLQSFTNALVGIADAGKGLAKSIGQIYSAIFGEMIGNMVAMGITCAVLLRIFGR